MKTVVGLKNLTRIERSVVALGFFDGVHKGHKKTILTCAEDAKAASAKSLVVTFLPHPKEVISPASQPPVLTDFDTKVKLISELGVDILLFIEFTVEFSKLSPEEFVDEILLKRLGAIEVIVGESFRFGSGALGDAKLLLELGKMKGFKVKIIPLKKHEGEPISSTRIRRLLSQGELEKAKEILGRYPGLSGKVVSGFGRGRRLGYSTANIQLKEEIQIPGDGVYAGVAHLNKRRLKSVINIGASPTFGVSERRIEAYLLDFEGDLYDKYIYLDLVAKIRDQKKFENEKELAHQLEDDVKKTAALLA